MGPFDQVPPMVTAQGYNDPQQTVGVATSPLDKNAAMAELLRRRNAAALQGQLSAGNAQMYGSQFQNPQFTTTTRGTGGAPDQVNVNWGDILGKGVANYMGASERKQALNSQQEVSDINNQFMQSTLQNDPISQKLYNAVQAGVPGAGKALSEHLAPKKQTLADLTQFITAGGSPEMAAEIAKSKGLDPQIAFRAAEFQTKNTQQKTTDKFGQEVILQDMKNTNQQNLAENKPGKSNLTPAELRTLPIEQRIAMAKGGNGETAESKARGKAKVAAQQELPMTDYAMSNINRVIDLAKKADYWPGNLGLKGDKMTTNTSNVNLRQALAQLTLDANGGKLGAGFSNADRDFMREAQTNLEAGNKATVVYQLNQLVDRLKKRQEQLRKDAGVPEPSAAAEPAINSNFDQQFPVGTFEGE